MNKRVLCILLFIFLLAGAGEGICSSPPGTGERVILFSDRNLYIAGERIRFSASLHQKNPAPEQFSRIIYCEVIAPDGTRISAGKFPVIDNNASGSLPVPSELVTGNYYLRAYTKYLRNSGPGSYSYIPVKIINPARSEVQEQRTWDQENEPADVSGQDAQFRILPDKAIYNRPGTIKISMADLSGNPPASLTVSVVPEHSLIPGNTDLSSISHIPGRIFYHRENLGISLSGKLTDRKTGDPLDDTRVNLSIIGKGRDYMSVETDSSGGFYFSLPDYHGNRDLFICSEEIDADPGLLIDNDFCTVPVKIPTVPFNLTSDEQNTALKMAKNLQVHSYFHTGSQQVEDTLILPLHSFYGKPDEILNIDEYIQLPDLEEYFNALTNLVRIRKRQGGKYIKVIGPQTSLPEYDPLVMIDFVAVEDLQGILALNPAGISRIEIVNSLYLKGDQTFGGIVSIISRKSDFAGINLPESGLFVNYSFLTPPSIEEKILPGKPDTRNTLYWHPGLKLDQNDRAEISFPVPDTPGRYVVVVRGISNSGNTFRQTAVFEVVTGKISSQ